MEKYFYIVSAFSISVLLSVIVIPQIMVISAEKKLYDIPDARKIHHSAISRLGGVAFVPIILFSLALLYAIYNLLDFQSYLDRRLLTSISMICCGLIILFLVGLVDDLVGMRYKSKFIAQILCGTLLTCSGIYFNNLQGLLGIYEIPPYLGIPLTIFAVVYIINAINLIDGVDGLASGICSFAVIGLGIHFFIYGMWIYAILCAITLGVLTPFFFFNVFGDENRGRKIFMGDTGSLTIGFIISALITRYSISEPNIIGDSTLGHAFSFLLIPLLDVVRVFVHRIRHHKHPFKPDRNHIHHKFIDAGLSPHQTMILILLIAATLAVVNTLLFSAGNIDINVVVAIDLVFYIILNLILTFRIKAKVKQAINIIVPKDKLNYE